MPTYEYRCPNGHGFEKFYRTISASERSVACPECGEMAERQLSAGAGLVFKGSGFYLTDYGKNAHARRGGAKPSASDGKARSGESGGEKKSTESAAGDGSSAAPKGGEKGGSPPSGSSQSPKKDG